MAHLPMTFIGETWINMLGIGSGVVQTVLDSGLPIPNINQCKCKCIKEHPFHTVDIDYVEPLTFYLLS